MSNNQKKKLAAKIFNEERQRKIDSEPMVPPKVEYSAPDRRMIWRDIEEMRKYYRV